MPNAHQDGGHRQGDPKGESANGVSDEAVVLRVNGLRLGSDGLKPLGEIEQT